MPLSRITSPFQSATANVYSPSANTVTIRTSSSDRVVVDSAGFTGFGAASQINHPFRITARPTTLGASPIAAWDGTTTPGISFNDNYPGVNFNGMYKYNPSGGTYYMGNGSLATIYLDPTSNNSDILISTANTGTANTISSPIERVRFNQFGIGLGQGVPSSGMGIRFPATQNASSDPNTLDDYEEGTWSPRITDNTNSSGAGLGHYRKIGNLVIAQLQLYNADISSIAAGNALYISGLPYAQGSSGASHQLLSTPSNTLYGSLLAHDMNGATTTQLYYSGGTDRVNWSTLTRTNWGGSSVSVYGTYIYRTAN